MKTRANASEQWGKVLGLIASISFTVGSILFLPAYSEHATMGVWAFISGSLLLFTASVISLIEGGR